MLLYYDIVYVSYDRRLGRSMLESCTQVCILVHVVTLLPCSSQVLSFVQMFADLLPDYEVVCEHEHSNCVLIAHKKVHSGTSLYNIIILT